MACSIAWETIGTALSCAVLVLSGCAYSNAPSRLEGEDYRIMPVAEYVDVLREAMRAEELFPAMTTFESTASYRVIYDDARYVSFQTQEYWYGGGAHGSTRVTVGTLDRRTGRLLRVADVVPAAKHSALQALLRERAIARLGGEDHLQGEVTVTENFYLAQDGLHFVYNQYEIACYADGITEVIVDPASLP